ncbi:MAG: flagellar protein export ATPase FliI [Oceanospirillales bacterium]|uniref:Flagellum-specific ATP synthase n=1 Tax=Marinobacterium halophilum TaxID=267374 RepID=A0A2P8ESF2_9GAMM|nr:flagellar protein export ATPase FliI [Marinobacterium halophilum]MBR9828788.1 flagellar protein export ATPase FliI [Oceanospirillales bacterium]PSL12365.1 flagellum-specific ATP synthase [Marinobacterium halophilum]
MPDLDQRLKRYLQCEYEPPRPDVEGRVTRLIGLTLEAVGLKVALGDYCLVSLQGNGSVEAEVVGFSGDRVYLMPLDSVDGLSPGAAVRPRVGASLVPVGFGLLGRVIDGIGRPLDGKGPLRPDDMVTLAGETINPLHRHPIEQTLDVGVRAINGLLTVGRGQRLGLFAGSGVGKSVLLGMMTRFTEAEITVVGLIGERGREVREFIDHSLGPEGMARSVVVAAPADDSPLMRLRAAQLTTRIAEYFRAQGKNVLLLMDSLTRYAQAQREIALAVGEPPATKGYPPSVFAKLPKLVERAGNGETGGGSITAFYTVLTEGDDQQDPVADSARAILDGHFVLSRSLAEQGHYPALDIEASISRAMPQIVDESQLHLALQFKRLYSRYQQNADLIAVGAYARGSDPETDRAVDMLPVIRAYLQQGMNEPMPIKRCMQELAMLMSAPPQQPQNATAQGQPLRRTP